MLGFDRLNLRGRLGRSAGPIGLEIEDQQIRIAQLEIKGGRTAIRDVACLRLRESSEALFRNPREARRVLNEAFRRGRFSGQDVITHAPTEDLRLMVLNYAADSSVSESAQILGLAQERIRDDLSDYVVDFVPIRTSGDQTGDRSALVAIAPEEPVVQHLERLRRAGLRVGALEIAPVSMRRLCAHSHLGTNEIVLLIRMLRKTTELTVLSGKRLLLFREVHGGLESLLSAAAKSMDSDEETAKDLLQTYGVGRPNLAAMTGTPHTPEDPLADATDGIVTTLRETIRPSLRLVVDQAHKAISYAAFQTRGKTLDKVFVLGGSHSCRGLDELLSEMLKLPVEVFDPASCLESNEDVRGRPSVQESAVAIGMALRGMDHA